MRRGPQIGGHADGGDHDRDRDRGQLVLLTAAAVAIALVALLFAYLGLAYAGDVDATRADDAPGRDLDQALDRGVVNATDVTAGRYRWSARAAAADAFRAAIRPDLRTLETARASDGVIVTIDYAPAIARSWADASCPDGRNRAFGPCEATGGVVVQKRAAEAVIVAAAFDLLIVGEDGKTRLTLVITVG